MRNMMGRSKARASLVGIVAAALLQLFSGGCAVKNPIVVVNKPSQTALTDWVTAVKAGIQQVTGQSASLNDVTGRSLAVSYSEAAVMARYTALRNSLLSGRATTKVLFDIVELGLTTAVPISNGARGKTILGSLATGFKGSNLSIDRNVFNEQSTATILSAMDTCVMRQERVIADKSGLPVDRYTIYNGYADLSRLYGCTTLAGALQELSENQAVAAKQEQQRTVIAPISQAHVTELQAIQAAFAESLRGDKKLALAFMKEMKVEGLTDQSDPKEFISAYRGLSAILDRATEVDRFVAAARTVKLLAPSTN